MPRNTYEQTTSPAFMGMASGNDPDWNAGNSRFFMRTVSKVADYTVLASEFGTFFNTFGATAAVAFSLPLLSTLKSGWWADFYSAADVGMTVKPDPTTDHDTLVTFNDVAADSIAYSTSGEIIGGYVRMVAIGTVGSAPTAWVAIPGNVSHRQTATIAS